MLGQLRSTQKKNVTSISRRKQKPIPDRLLTKVKGFVCFFFFSWSWNSNTLATWCEEPAHWKRPWCWERLKTGGEGDNRGWDGWMARLTRWTWVWVSSRSWWWTEKHVCPRDHKKSDMTEQLNWTEFPLLGIQGLAAEGLRGGLMPLWQHTAEPPD